ncbi:FAD-binding domain-containing protein [Daedaleopsis nitida]|nr:FAD-binding domain-containing protein [Daedaleopsis nitida]
MRGTSNSLALISFASVAFAASASLTNSTSGAFVRCLESARLEPVVPGDASYTADTAPFNRRLPWKPAAIVYPKDAKGVSAAVQCGTVHNVKVNARGGGHSYAAYGLGGEDGHLIVSLDDLRHLSISGDVATIGAGNRLGDVALFLWDNGQRAMAHGTCPFVGIGGHATQGGFGLTSRSWGLLSDQVRSIEIVLASGALVTASPTQHPDLFWAAMGAGASFGIITSFTTVTQKAPTDIVAFSYMFADYGPREASAGMQAWQKFSGDTARPLDPHMGLQLHVNPGDGPNGVVFYVSGVYYNADMAKLNATMAPLLAELGTPTSTFFQSQDWITNVLYLAGVNTAAELNTTKGVDGTDFFYATSTIVSHQEPLGMAATDGLMDYFYGPGSDTNVSWFIITDLYGGGKSAVTSRAADFNSFDARDALYTIQYYGTIPSSVPTADGIAFIQGMKASVEEKQPRTAFKEYVNYIDSTYSAEVAHEKYYPTNTKRLTELKNRYDPGRIIHHPQDF